MPVKLKTINLKDYRSCKDTSFSLHKELSVLIGVNGSGKTNLLKGIMLLKKAANNPGYRRPEYSDESLLSNSKMSVEFLVDKHPITYHSLVRYHTSETNVDTVVDSLDQWDVKAITNEKNLVYFPLSLTILQRYFPSHSENQPSETIEQNLPLLQYLWRQSNMSLDISTKITIPKENNIREVSRTVFNISNFASNIKYYSASQFTDPSKCPNFLELENGQPRDRSYHPGGSHLRFLFDLYTTYQKDQDKFDEFMSVVGEEGIGLIEKIVFEVLNIPSSTYQVYIGGQFRQIESKKELIIPQIVIQGAKLSPNQLSEGTFKTLPLLFYIMTDDSPLLLIEEPEVCVHHGLLSSIIDIIKTFSKTKQIVVSTHSDYVLDLVDPKNVFIVHNELGIGTLVEHVPKSMSSKEYKALKDYLANVGSLGEYWRSGGLEE